MTIYHLTIFLFKPKGQTTRTTTSTTTTTTHKPRGERRRPGSRKPKTTTATPMSPSAERVQLGSSSENGNIRFLCKINLSPHETAIIIVKAHLVTNSLNKLYQSAANFKIISNAEILPNEAYTLKPSGNATIVTVAKTSDPVYPQGN